MKTVYVKRDESLKDLFAVFQAFPTPANRQALYAVLTQAQVYVGSPLMDADILKGAGASAAEHKLPLMTAVAKDGSRAVVAFCDEASLLQENRDLYPITLEAKQLMRMALNEGVDALMLKQGDFWLGVPKADLQRLTAG